MYYDDHPNPYQSTGNTVLSAQDRFQFLWPVFAAALCQEAPLGAQHQFSYMVYWTHAASRVGSPPSILFDGRSWDKWLYIYLLSKTL